MGQLFGQFDPVSHEVSSVVSVVSNINSPFYSCMLSCQAFEQEWAKGDLVMIQTLWLFKCKLLDTGLYHNKVTFSLTPNQRLGN